MSKIDEIISRLKSEFPGKAIVFNPPDNPEEIVCEVQPASQHPEYSVAIAYIKSSKPHRHAKTVETYQVEDGDLDLYLDGVKNTFHPSQSYSVQPEVIHWAQGNWTRVKVKSEPGWKMEDHLLVNKDESAGKLYKGIKGINHVTILVNDKDKAREFYTDILGLEPINVGKSLWMKAGSQFIHVSKNSGNPVTGTFYHFAIEADDFNTYINDLIQKGIEVFDLDSDLQKVKINTDLDDKTRQFFVNDPDGNIVEMIDTNNPFFKGL